MAIQINAKSDSGFDDPLGILKDCHRRIERFSDVLCLVAERARERALTEEERQAIAAALRYFRESGPRHNADEEESLFPRIAGAAMAEIERLEADHRRTAELHASIEHQMMDWMEQGRAENPDRLRLETGTLQRIYRDHIQVEETVVFPRAAALLSGDAIAAMGDEFRARRR